MECTSLLSCIPLSSLSFINLSHVNLSSRTFLHPHMGQHKNFLCSLRLQLQTAKWAGCQPQRGYLHGLRWRDFGKMFLQIVSWEERNPPSLSQETHFHYYNVKFWLFNSLFWNFCWETLRKCLYRKNRKKTHVLDAVLYTTERCSFQGRILSYRSWLEAAKGIQMLKRLLPALLLG